MADNDNEMLPEEEQREMAPDEVEALRSELAAMKDRALRALADAENTRKRAEREKAETSQYAVASFARSLLPVADNLRRALDALHAEKRTAMDDNARAILDGVEATERELQGVLARHGVKLIEAAGARFDPHLHHAVAEVPAQGQEAGTVVNVIQSGYTIGERLLRPAMVTVAKSTGPGQTAGNGAGPGSRIDTKI
jgi:molecular chaperone GrpE